jgi:TorA maturation chaperone TorD
MTAGPELFRALGAMCEGAGPEHAALAEALDLPGVADPADYADLFLFQLPPYASIYLGSDGMMGGEATDRVSGFWRAVRAEPRREPDHLASLLGLYAWLCHVEQEEEDPARRALRRESRRALLWEHLLSWVEPYTWQVTRVGSPVYAAWARLLLQALLSEGRTLGRPEGLSAHLREAPGPAVFGDGSDDGPQSLFVPIRAGMILTRCDLAACARAMGLTLRLGNRPFVLRSLLAQERSGTIEWLAAVAEAWATHHGSVEDETGEVATFWRGRAETAREELRGMIAVSDGEALALSTRKGASA